MTGSATLTTLMSRTAMNTPRPAATTSHQRSRWADRSATAITSDRHSDGKTTHTVKMLPANARGRRTREALLAAARALLEEAGFEGLTMAAVAQRAGVTRRAVYLHFGCRSDLVTALFGYVNETEDLRASLRPVHEAPD